MSDSPWEDDYILLAELQAAVRAHREVPASFVEAGKAAFDWRQIDTVLAEMTYDSMTSDDPHLLAGVRGAGTARFLSFTGQGLEVELELSSDAVRGQVIPPTAATVELKDDADFWVSTRCDEQGWFVISPIPDQAFRLTVRASGILLRTGSIDR